MVQYGLIEPPADWGDRTSSLLEMFPFRISNLNLKLNQTRNKFGTKFAVGSGKASTGAGRSAICRRDGVRTECRPFCEQPLFR